MYAARLGERALAMNPFRMMLAHGLVLAGGSDSPVTLLDPFGAMAAAAGHHVPGFSVSVDDALRMFTLGGALAAHEEWERGSLEVGKRADLCVVSEDPTAGEAADLAGIQVLETWVGGKRVWSASGGSAPTEAGEEAEPGFRWSRERELPPRLF
ncbi:MAG: amidohydrolase family protein [Actinomycetota bacterium]